MSDISAVPPPASGPMGSWMVPLADLSLILFVVTSIALAGALKDQQGTVDGPFGQSVPNAIYTDVPGATGAPDLSAWLAREGQDGAAQLTISAAYAQGERAAVEARAEALAQQAIAAGLAPRVVIEPAPRSQVLAMFAYDRDPQVAQTLLSDGQN